MTEKNEPANKIKSKSEIRQLFKCWLWGLAAVRNNEEMTVSIWRQEGFGSCSFFPPGSTFSQALLCRIVGITKFNGYPNYHQKCSKPQELLLWTCLTWHKDIFLRTKQEKGI